MQLPNISEFAVGGFKDRALSPFSRYYRGKASIATQDIPVQAVFPFVTVSRDAKLALIKNSKSGCTSLAKAIYTYDTGSNFTGNIHRNGDHLAQGYSHWKSNFDSVMSKTSFNVTAVRNPTDRIVSAFFDFVVEQRNPIRTYYTALFEDFDLSADIDLPSRFDRFLDFVDASMSIDPWKTDRHWRLQSLNIWHEKIEYDLILRTDRLEAGYARIRDALNIDEIRLPLYHVNRSKTGKGLDPTPKQTRRIEDLYATDFDLFESLTS